MHSGISAGPNLQFHDHEIIGGSGSGGGGGLYGAMDWSAKVGLHLRCKP
ncbi:hypothetical protein CNE_BB1p01130 (plasmid) [Cupriavidus necator N-1]|uniref:Uncharacterized protein n=1 Tax=Cupriavidus necator (strain ATCC 43291 / DSM 13513 / CCUG 52238 / LMG 8453 / N-1) TaxID=1042878 RepID=F8GVI1_CUPNN|nr:hypothetical protein CNE_BB1p01130 [Cupriavidus necator N-1]